MARLDRYLALLGVPHGPPDRALLSNPVAAQIRLVPFESISKLYRVRVLGMRTLPSLEEHLDGIESQKLGGTCYASNWYFLQLLQSLGPVGGIHG